MNVLMPGRFATGWRLALMVAIGAAQAASSVLLIRSVERAVATAGDSRGTAIALVAAGIGAAMLALLRLAEFWQAEAMAQRIVHGLRKILARHLLNLPPRGRRAGRSEILLRFMGEMATLRNWHMRAIPTLVVALPVVAGGCAFLTLRNAWLGLAVALPVVVTVGLQLALSRPHLETAENARRARSRLAGEVSARFDALPVVQAYGRTGQALRRIEHRSRRFADAMVARAFRAGLMRASAELGATGLLVSIAALGLLDPAIPGSALAGALAFATILAPRLRALGRIPEQLNLALVAQRRVDAFLSEPLLDLRESGPGLAARTGRLALRGLTCADGRMPFDARAKAGARVLVVGPNGAGKSRLFGLIAGLEDPESGRIVLDGRDVGRRRRTELRKRVAIAGDGMPLVRGTVADNIALGARAPAEERGRILAICRWHDLERNLPRGAMTRVGTGAPELSAGQRAQIALIRALMRKPVVLILDHVDAFMDRDARRALRDVMIAFEGTILFATHDPDLAALATARWELPGRNETCREARNA